MRRRSGTLSDARQIISEYGASTKRTRSGVDVYDANRVRIGSVEPSGKNRWGQNEWTATSCDGQKARFVEHEDFGVAAVVLHAEMVRAQG